MCAALANMPEVVCNKALSCSVCNLPLRPLSFPDLHKIQRPSHNTNFTVPKTVGTLEQPSVNVGSCIRVGRFADCTGQDSYTGNVLTVSTSKAEQHKDTVIFIKLHTALLRMRRQIFCHPYTLILIFIALCSLAWVWGSFGTSCRIHLETKRWTN